MKFIDAYTNVLKAFGDFKSRTGRTEFWVFTIINIIISMVIGYLSNSLSMVYSLIVLVPGLAVGVRRLHDVGKSGVNFLWVFLPVIGWIYLIILFIKESQPVQNKWGEVPQDISI